MNTFLFYIDEQSKQAVRHVSVVTGGSMGEVIRQMVSHCVNEESLNRLYPQCSGNFCISGGVR